jgi:hypothetical protein
LRKAHRHASGVEIQHDLARSGLTAQNESRAQRGMSGEGQFFLYGEDAHTHAAGVGRCGIPGQNEGSFGEIHLQRQSLHLLGAEAAAVEKYRQ